MQRVWGSENVGLYALPAVLAQDRLYGVTVCFPTITPFVVAMGAMLSALRSATEHSTLRIFHPRSLTSLSAAYGEPVAAEDVFDAILCLLSATSYTLRFAEDLEDVFPHVPFPAEPAIFEDAVRVGREIRAVETFARRPGKTYRRPDFVRIASEPRGVRGGSRICRRRDHPVRRRYGPNYRIAASSVEFFRQRLSCAAALARSDELACRRTSPWSASYAISVGALPN